MDPEVFSDYVCYDIDSYYHKNPYGPNRCPMCAGDLSQAEMEPSKAIRDEIVQAEKLGIYVNSRATFLHICNKCHWWCIRDACEFVEPQVAVRYHRDYLIFAITEKSEPKASKDAYESTQPWLKALNNPKVYNKVQKLPEELAVFIYKQPDLPGSMSVSQQVIKNLSKYDPFIGKTKDLIAKKRKKKLYKKED